MIRDKVVLGGFVGVLSMLAKDVFEFPLWRLKMVKHPLAHYAASLFMDPKSVHNSFIGQIISLFADLAYGLFWGIVFVYLIYLTGKGHFLLKGLMFGAFLWFFSFGVLRSLAMVTLRETVAANSLYYLLIHLIFGLALGFTMKILNQRKLID